VIRTLRSPVRRSAERPDAAAQRPRRRPFAAALGLLALIAALLLAAPGQAQARYASIVIDAETGQVLHAANADTRNYPASLTKMMTLYMTFEALDEGRLSLNQRLPVSKRAQGMVPSKLYLQAGATIRVKDAILALVTKSANDAAVVLAEALGGTEWQFAIDMTEKARALGMSRTTFRNASGLPNRGQLSTARDMARLSQALLYDYPEYYHYFSTTRFRYSGRTYGNHNNLLDDYRGTDGIKTGYIRASGFNLAASVVRDGRRLIAVVFGGRTARSRDAHIKKLLSRGFNEIRHRETIPVVAPPPRKPTDAIRVAAARAAGDAHAVSGVPKREAKVVTVSAAVGSAPTAAAPPVPPREPDAIAALAQRITETAPVPPATARPDAIRRAARKLAAATGPYAVQVGAYRQAAPAHRAATRAADAAPRLLAPADVSVSRIRGHRGPLYRARLVGLSQDRARQACRALVADGTDCLVIQPRGGVEVALNARSRN
jgi:D-alanyl-D-alanine carboxypeptidase